MLAGEGQEGVIVQISKQRHFAPAPISCSPGTRTFAPDSRPPPMRSPAGIPHMLGVESNSRSAAPLFSDEASLPAFAILQRTDHPADASRNPGQCESVPF